MNIKSGFWKDQINISILLGLITFIILAIYHSSGFQEIHKNGILLMTIFSGFLMELTLLSFTIVIILMPNIRTDFLSSKLFEEFLKTFRIVMYVQLLSIINGIISYFVFGTVLYLIGELTSIIFTIYSLGFFIFLFNLTFLVVKIARNKITGVQ